jgi:hypothetical protein
MIKERIVLLPIQLKEKVVINYQVLKLFILCNKTMIRMKLNWLMK